MKELLIVLIPILLQVESGDNPSALGDYKNGVPRAVGCLQIWKIVVDDCNRIQKDEVFTYNDRTERPKSIRMAQIYLNHYGIAYERKTGLKANLEVLSRMWNGGPNGYKKKETLKYWRKIEKHLQKGK